MGVYPRAGGATARPAGRRQKQAGLSPRWRGNLLPLQPTLVCNRSIPALAGQPDFLSVVPALLMVYPRAGGATRSIADPYAFSQGLSPRWRGNPLPAVIGKGHQRSIPALAGQPGSANV